MHAIHGVPQHYPWGDPEAIPEILGRPADGRPWAEWWLGTHPDGAATMADGSPLANLSGELPYLLKLLAAAQPLSLQAHPSEQQATAGFNRERREGIANGLYRDPHAKPEMLCALTEFDALCGFRRVVETVLLLRELGSIELATTLENDGLQSTVIQLYRGHIDCEAAIAECARHRSPESDLVTRLAEQYPNDPSVVVTLLLNRVRLRPSDALFLDAGNLHAYLSGVGVEVMGASDNVIRGGLTGKAIDIDELLNVLRFEALDDPVLLPVEGPQGRWRYPTADAPFELWRYEVVDPIKHAASTREVLLCTGGDGGVLRRGAAVYLEPGETIDLTGPSTVFRVGEG